MAARMPQRLKRTMHGALAAGVVIAAVAVSGGTAVADTPSTNNSSGSGGSGGSTALDSYNQLSDQADQLNEQLDQANAELQQKQAQEKTAQAQLVTAQQAETTAAAQENQYLSTVDDFTAASFEGARMDQLSALLTGNSAQDYLNRATDLANLAADDYAVLNKYQSAVNTADAAAKAASAAEKSAQDAITTAQNLIAQIGQQSTEINQKIAQMTSDISQLSPAEQAELRSTGPNMVFVPPPGVRGEAMMLALGKRGSEYVWGAVGPSTFDCSGLVVWAYEQLGISLPHYSGALAQLGTPVSQADLEPGDLVFFGDPVHHVGIYVGNGMMVDAPATGQVVRVQPLFSGYSGARRLNY